MLALTPTGLQLDFLSSRNSTCGLVPHADTLVLSTITISRLASICKLTPGRLNGPRGQIRTSPGMRLIGRSGSRGAKKPYSMSSREIEVLQWVAHGKSAREIAVILNITKRTIDAHVLSAVQKMGAVSRTNAVAIAIRDRIIKV